MANSISRRNFFSKIGDLGSEVLKGLNDPDDENLSENAKVSAPENPFPGQLYWDFHSSQWRPAFGVDADGRLLPSFDDEKTFLVSLDPPPKNSAVFHFRVGKWVLPLGGKDVLIRIIVDQRLKRENFFIKSKVAEVQNLQQEFQEAFPDLDISQAALIGKEKASDTEAEDIFTITFKAMDPFPEVVEKYGAQELVKEKSPKVFMYKCFMKSKRVLLKLYEETHHLDASLVSVPAIPLPAQNKPSHFGFTFHEGGVMDPVRDFNFYATNEDVREYCQEMGLAYPENLFDVDQDVQAFGVSYNHETGKVLRVKRYYTWWMLEGH